MMNRSVSGGGPMAGQPGALENVKYMTSREFQACGGRLPPTAGQDVGNRNKVSALKPPPLTPNPNPKPNP